MANFKYRMYEETDLIKATQFTPLVQSLERAKKHLYAFKLSYYIATPSNTLTEFSVWDNELDAIDTPTLLNYRSSASLDKNAAGGTVRTIKIIGFTVDSLTDYQNGDEEPKWTIETCNMDSSDGTTLQTTSKYYLRVVHVYASAWGTGDGSSHTANGDITVENDDQMSEITTIKCKAKTNCTNAHYVTVFAADGDNTETEHYFWLDTDTAASDPGASGTGHEVAIDGDTSADDVATTLQGVIDGVTNLSATVSTDTVTVTCDKHGTTTDASQSNDSFDTITTTQQGVDITDLVTISGGDNDSNGSKIIIPEGWAAIITRIELDINASPTNLYDGTQVEVSWTGLDAEKNTAPDINSRTVTSTILSGENINQERFPIPMFGSDGAILTFKEKKLNSALATDANIIVFMWKER